MVGSSGFNTKALIAKSGFAAFQFREYRYFWLAAAFSNLGMWALIYGRLWLMHKLTESPLMVGLVTTASLGPLLLFCVFGIKTVSCQTYDTGLIQWHLVKE